MLRQQRKGLVALPLRLEHRPAQDLHAAIIGIVLRKVLHQLERGVGVAGRVLGQGLHGGQVGGVIAVDGGQDLGGLAEGDLGAQLQDARGEGILGRESGGVEVDHFLVLALVVGIVDVDEFWNGVRRSHRSVTRSGLRGGIESGEGVGGGRRTYRLPLRMGPL